MTAVIRPLTASPAWKSLEAHHQKIRESHLRELFSDDPKRGERMTVEAVGIYLDYSKNLRRLSEYLHTEGRSLFMFELLVLAEKAQLDRFKGDKKAYELEVRPGLMVQTMRQLQDAGVEPDVWKIEGLDRREDCEKIVDVARRGGRGNVGCIILGRAKTTTRSGNG
jgi:hypothetical protein